ncbi:MAG: response regulator, partial [Candidatus Fimimonas sp.]
MTILYSTTSATEKVAKNVGLLPVGEKTMYKMMIVDDEYLVRLGISETIDWASYGVEIVDTAVNGKEGLEKILQQKPDVVISDIKMPVMDGTQLVKALNEQNYDGIVVILSGYNDFQYAKDTLEMGVFKYVLKPIDNDELVQTVLAALRKLEQKRKTNMYMSDFSVGIPVIKNSIADSLFHGDFAEQEIVQKMELYDLPVVSRGCVIYCKADRSSAGTDAIVDENMRHALSLVEKLALHALHGSKTFYSRTEQRVAFATDCVDLEKLEKTFIEILREYEKQSRVLVSVGISNVFEGLQGIAEAFSQAKFIA